MTQDIYNISPNLHSKTQPIMTHTQFLLQLKFNVATFHNDFTIKEANETTLGYVKQKMFNLRENVDVFTNESQL